MIISSGENPEPKSLISTPEPVNSSLGTLDLAHYIEVNIEIN